jgi:hypothetical protein
MDHAHEWVGYVEGGVATEEELVVRQDATVELDGVLERGKRKEV